MYKEKTALRGGFFMGSILTNSKMQSNEVFIPFSFKEKDEAMSDWTHGYVTDIEYTAHFYPELAPTMMYVNSLSKNVVFPSPEQTYNWLEIGCGNGLSANALAACNSQSQFYAFDFNPVHILNAQKIAKDMGLSNVHFFDDSFEQAVERDLPQMDFIVLHGIYSWVSKENQAHILNIINKFLKLGGVVYVSYNCLPGWSNKAPLRHLMTEYAARLGGDVGTKVDAIKNFLDELKDGQFQYMISNPAAVEMTQKLREHNSNYLAHEYLNADWNLFYSNEIAQDMKTAKLNFAASATILENADEINFDKKTIDRIRQEKDSDMRELLKDFARNRQFRRDLFVKGKRGYDQSEINQLKKETKYTLYVPRQACKLDINVSLGSVTLSDKIYEPILDALQKNPQSLEQLVEATGHSLALLVNALTILAGVGYVILYSDKVTKESTEHCKKFNRIMLERNLQGESVTVLVAPNLKTAFPISEIDQFFLYFSMQKSKDMAQDVRNAMKKINKNLIKSGEKIEGEIETLKELNDREALFKQEILPLLTVFGVI